MWDFNNGNFESYRNEILTTDWEPYFRSTEINTIVSELTETILLIAKKHIPNKRVTVRPTDKPWYNGYLRRLKRQKLRLFRLYKRDKSPEVWNQFRDIRREYESEVKRIKYEHEQKQYDSLSDTKAKSTKTWWSLLKRITNGDNDDNNIPPISHNGEMITKDKDKADLFNQYFVSVSSIDDTGANIPTERRVFNNGNNLSNLEITEQEVLDQMHILDVSKSYGPDNIPPRLIKVLGESASYPMYIRCYVNVIKFWFKILHSPANSLLRSCYDMLVEHANAGRRNWAYDVRHLLYRQGFGNIWEQQMIENEQDFLAEFNDRLQSSYVQEWNGIKSETSKLSLYNLYKSTFVREMYLSFDIPYRLRRYLAKFRTSNVSLEIEIGRRHGVPREDRLCKLCGEYNRNFVEDEFHVLLECHSYSEIRKIYLGDVTATLFTFVSIMNSNEEKLIIL